MKVNGANANLRCSSGGVVFALILFFCPVSSRTAYFLADALQIDARFLLAPSKN
jgi:hypothetical protein